MTAPPGQTDNHSRGVDHLVVNAKSDLDRVVSEFEQIGFSPTARGYHSLGSMNHLLVFARSYLELIGVPKESPSARPEISHGRPGLDGLVLSSPDVQETHRRLEGKGFTPQAPEVFSRPVVIDGREQEARFRTVRLRPREFPAGRVYFCEHATPELVWRDEWRHHPNGVTAMDEIVVTTQEPEREARRFGTLTDRDAEPDGIGTYVVRLQDFVIRVVSPTVYVRMYGYLALDSRESRFGALGLRSTKPFELSISGSAAGWVAGVSHSGKQFVRNASGDVLLEFSLERDSDDK